MSATAEQMPRLLARSTTVRQDKARIRRELQNHTLNVIDVLRDPPHSIRHLLVTDILLWQGQFGRDALQRLNYDAVRDGVNLMARVSFIPTPVIDWLEGHPWAVH